MRSSIAKHIVQRLTLKRVRQIEIRYSHAPPMHASRRERSAEQSRISCAYYPKQVMTNEIVRSVIRLYYVAFSLQQ